ncbi:MAG: hypothetical protein ABR981_01945 [Candidatus Micrarchaeaceae archaeon]|jgi:hypothetical protein
MAGSKSGNNMIMIVAAVVVVIIIVAAAVLLTGKGGAQRSTTIATTTAGTSTLGSTSIAATTVNTTTVTQQSNNTFSSWEGKNLSLNTFSQELGQDTFAKLASVNALYDFNISITESTNTTKLNGSLMQELYQNSSRTTTNLTYSGHNIQTVSIYNASSHTSYTCSGASGSYTCYVTSLNESISNGNSAINYVISKGGANTTVNGYFSNIQVSDSSVNGQPCTLITGNLYVNAVSAKGSYVLSNGILSACISNQNNLSLKTILAGTTKLTTGSSAQNGSFNYTETLIGSGSAPTAAITALPGPVTT